MKLLLFSLLFSSNLSAAVKYEKYIVGYKCPDGYYLRVSDLMCHFAPNSVKSISPVLAKNKLSARVTRVKRGKPVKMADRPIKIDCTRVMNQCFKGDL